MRILSPRTPSIFCCNSSGEYLGGSPAAVAAAFSFCKALTSATGFVTFLEELMTLKDMPDEELDIVRDAVKKMVPTFVHKTNKESREKAKKYNKQQKKANEKLLNNELAEDAGEVKKSKGKKDKSVAV